MDEGWAGSWEEPQDEDLDEAWALPEKTGEISVGSIAPDAEDVHGECSDSAEEATEGKDSVADFLRSLPVGARQGPLLAHYEVCLLVDAHEKLSRSDRAHALCDLVVAEGLVACVKPLPVGDFLWVAMPRAPLLDGAGAPTYHLTADQLLLLLPFLLPLLLPLLCDSESSAHSPLTSPHRPPLTGLPAPLTTH